MIDLPPGMCNMLDHLEGAYHIKGSYPMPRWIQGTLSNGDVPASAGGNGQIAIFIPMYGPTLPHGALQEMTRTTPHLEQASRFAIGGEFLEEFIVTLKGNGRNGRRCGVLGVIIHQLGFRGFPSGIYEPATLAMNEMMMGQGRDGHLLGSTALWARSFLG